MCFNMVAGYASGLQVLRNAKLIHDHVGHNPNNRPGYRFRLHHIETHHQAFRLLMPSPFFTFGVEPNTNPLCWSNAFQYGAHPEDSNLSLNRQILLTSHWISAGILYYITILKHTSQYTDDLYVFTISFFGQSKGSLARLCILSVTSQEIYFNMVTHCGVDFETTNSPRFSC